MQSFGEINNGDIRLRLLRLKKRIIYTVNYSPWSTYSGGGQRSTHSLATTMARRGHDVHVIYSRGFKETVTPPENLLYQDHWATLLQRHSRRNAYFRPLTAWSVRSIARKLILESRLPVIIHTNGDEGWLLPELKKELDFKLISTPRYSDYPAMLDGWPDVTLTARCLLYARNWKYICQASLLNQSDHICPPSKWASDEVIRLFDLDPDHVTTIHNGIPDHFEEKKQPERRPDGPIIYFGRLSRDKGVDLIIRAYDQIRESAPPLWIIGKGEEEKKLKNMVNHLQLDRDVHFLEWQTQTDLVTLVGKSSMVVLPSRRENFSLALLSAMSAGRPVISTWAGGTPEIISDQVNGLLVPADDTHQLALALKRLLKNREFATRLGINARDHVQSTLTWEKAGEKTDALYDRLLDERRRSILTGPSEKKAVSQVIS